MDVENAKKENASKNSENTVFVGNKPLMSYVTSTVMQLKTVPEVTIKARGKFISKAVDITEVIRKRFLKEKIPEIKEIKIGTEEYSIDSRQIKVSTIDIILANSR